MWPKHGRVWNSSLAWTGRHGCWCSGGLAALDYLAGAADGLFGPATRAALRRWQAAKAFAATGYLTHTQAEALIALGYDAAVAQRQREEAERLAQEEAAARQAHAADDAAYAEAQQVDTAVAYGEYLAAYPAGAAR